jgi:hypothetical protein
MTGLLFIKYLHDTYMPILSRKPLIKFHFTVSIPSGAKEAAGKGLDLKEEPEKHPSGAKALVDLIAFAAPFGYAQGRL